MATMPFVPGQFEESDQHRKGFDEATHNLLMAELATDRADAARELGTMGRPAAAAYLVAALHDSSSEVRRASAESLGLIGDSAAIAPLSELQERENNGQAPDPTISNAIFAITSRQADLYPTIHAPILLSHEGNGSRHEESQAGRNGKGNLSREQDQRLAQLDEIRIEVETEVS
jgi:hypothetical protein